MNTLKYTYLTLLLLFSFAPFAQSELNFYVNNQKLPFPKGTVCWLDSSNIKSHAHFRSHLSDFTSSVPTETSNLNGQLWILIPLANIRNDDRTFLYITNPHINYLNVWWLSDSLTIEKEHSPTGDHLEYNSRELLTLNYAFSAPKETNANFLLISLDKRKEILTANIHLSNVRTIERRSTQETILFGWLVGIVVVIIIVSLVLFASTQEKIYFIYFLFLFFMVVYSFADFGFIQWIFAFDHAKNLDSIRPITLALGMIFYVYFIEQILETQAHFPKLKKILRITFLGFITLLVSVSAIYFASSNNEITKAIAYYGVVVSHNSQRILIFILLIIVFQSIRKKIKYSEIIGISITLFLSVHFINHFYEVGYLEDQPIFQHSLPFVYTIDCLLMSVIIARKFLSFQKETLKLSQDLLIQKIEYNKTLNDVKAKDLSRISHFLHDNIGAELSAMRYDLEKYKDGEHNEEVLERIIEKSNFIANEVRNASHNLSPTMLERFGLKQSIWQFLGKLTSSSKINFQFEVLGEIDELPKNYNIIIFQVVQESCQNILKHSQAKNVIIQLLRIPDKIQIFIEDDGIGFSENSTESGLGIESMKQLIEFNSGIFKVDGLKKNGVKIYAELPTTNN
jgi:signal transduction histidine kinase